VEGLGEWLACDLELGDAGSAALEAGSGGVCGTRCPELCRTVGGGVEVARLYRSVDAAAWVGWIFQKYCGLFC
jgi:hypothetical protein